MTAEEIVKLISMGEGLEVEFKESKEALSKNVYETVCSFNNRKGGHIILGVKDDKEIVGVNPDKVQKQIKDFITTINNSEKIYPPLYLTPEEVDIDGKKIIYIRVPDGKQACRYNGRFWDRSFE